MMKKIILAGGTVFMGSYLRKRFSAEAYQVLVISRGKQYISWNDDEVMLKALDAHVP